MLERMRSLLVGRSSGRTRAARVDEEGGRSGWVQGRELAGWNWLSNRYVEHSD